MAVFGVLGDPIGRRDSSIFSRENCGRPVNVKDQAKPQGRHIGLNMASGKGLGLGADLQAAGRVVGAVRPPGKALGREQWDLMRPAS